MMNRYTTAEDNVKKYLKPPTFEQIFGFVKEVGVSIYRFELYYGISINHLAKVRCGQRELAKEYWHIFYERIMPVYGIGITVKYLRPPTPKRLTKEIPKKIPPFKTKPTVQEKNVHDRLTTIK